MTVFLNRSAKDIRSVAPVRWSSMYENVDGSPIHLLLDGHSVETPRFTTGAPYLWPSATEYSWKNENTKTRSNRKPSDRMNRCTSGWERIFGARSVIKFHRPGTIVRKLWLANTIGSIPLMDTRKTIVPLILCTLYSMVGVTIAHSRRDRKGADP